MYPSTTVLPKEALKAWHLLGNSVSPLQCAVGFLALDLARGKVTRQAADCVLTEFVNDALQLNGSLVEVKPGWVKLVASVPVEANECSPLSVPTPADSMASDDSRIGHDDSFLGTQLCPTSPEENQTPTSSPATTCVSHVHTPERIETPEKQVHTELFNRISGEDNTWVKQLTHLDPRLPGSNEDPLEELPATIKWKPILSTLEILASLDNDDTPDGEYLNQNAPGSPNMSRPIGASSTSPMASRGADDIPEPKTPPQPPSSSRARSRSPLPRYRQPSTTMGGSVRKVLVRTQDTVEELYLHETQPLGVVKMMIALPDATQCVRLEYKHAPLASHTTIGALPDNAWLFASYSTSNSLWWRRALDAQSGHRQGRCIVSLPGSL